MKIKTSLTEIFRHDNDDTYVTLRKLKDPYRTIPFQRYAICDRVVQRVLHSRPPLIKVKGSAKPFKGARHLWIRRGTDMGMIGAWVWTRKAALEHGELRHDNAFFDYIIEKIQKLIPPASLAAASPAAPVKLYFSIKKA